MNPPGERLLRNVIAKSAPCLKSLDQSELVFIDAGVGMVVAPVEPIVLQGGNTVQAFPLSGTRGRAALKIPLAGGCGIEQIPVFLPSLNVGVGLQKEFGVVAINTADKNAEGFPIGSEEKKQRHAVHAINNRRFCRETFPGIGARGAADGESDDNVVATSIPCLES